MTKEKKFIMIKRKNTKEWLGAIPLQSKDTTIAEIREELPQKVKDDFDYKIVNQKQLETIILKQRPRGNKWIL